LVAPTGSETLYSSYFDDGDNITCIVNLTDGVDRSSERISVIIGMDPIPINITNQTNQTNTTGDDNSTNITGHSSSPSIEDFGSSPFGMVEEDDQVSFRVNWTDLDQQRYNSSSSEEAILYICDSENINRFGCVDEMYCMSAYDDGYELECSYTITNLTPRDNVYYVMVCDDSGNCSGISDSTFYANRKPDVDSMLFSVIGEDEYLPRRTLRCNFMMDDPDGDPPSLSESEFRWFVKSNIAGTGSFEEVLPSPGFEYENFIPYKGDQVYCSVRVHDYYNLSADSFVDSRIYQFNNSLPELVSDVEKVSKSSWYVDISSSSDFDGDDLMYMISCDADLSNTSGIEWVYESQTFCTYTTSSEKTLLYGVSDGNASVYNYSRFNVSLASGKSLGGSAGGSTFMPGDYLSNVTDENDSDDNSSDDNSTQDSGDDDGNNHTDDETDSSGDNSTQDSGIDDGDSGFEGITGEVIGLGNIEETDYIFNPLSYLAFFVFLMIAVFAFIYDHFRRDDAVEINQETVQENEADIVNDADDVNYDKMLARLDDYVVFMLKNGHDPYRVKIALVNEGWNEEIVDEVIDKHSIRLR